MPCRWRMQPLPSAHLRTLGVDVHRQPAPGWRGTGIMAVCVYPLSPLTVRVGRRAQHHRHHHRLVALRCAERASHAAISIDSRAAPCASRSLQRRQCHAHRRVLAFLLDSRHLLAPHAGRAQGPVIIDRAAGRQLRRQRLSQRAAFSPEFDRTVFASTSRMCACAPTATTRRTRSRSHGRFPVVPGHRDSGRAPSSRCCSTTRPTARLSPRHPLPFRPSTADVNYLGLDAAPTRCRCTIAICNSVHYVDRLVGEVLAEVEARGLLKNSVVLITGDHGQEFNDNRRNYWGHDSNFTPLQTGVPFSCTPRRWRRPRIRIAPRTSTSCPLSCATTSAATCRSPATASVAPSSNLADAILW